MPKENTLGSHLNMELDENVKGSQSENNPEMEAFARNKQRLQNLTRFKKNNAERQENPVAELGISQLLHRSPRNDEGGEDPALTAMIEDENSAAEKKSKTKKRFGANLIPDIELVRFRRSDVLEEFLANPPDESEGGWAMFRYQLGHMMESTCTRFTVAAAIVINAIIVGIYANKQMSDQYYDIIDTMFTIFFTLEITLKILAFGWAIYLSDAWNVYDFIIVVCSLLEKLITVLPLNATVMRLVRVLRVFRFFRLVSAFQSLNKLVVALWESMLEVAWVGVLAVLVVYMVACLTTTLIGDDESLDGDGALLAYEYFGTVQRSMLTLLQVMTTDGWCSEMARAFMEVNNMTTIIVIVLWVIASALILMNLLAAIFVDKLMQLTDDEKVKEQEKQEKKKRELMEKLKEIFLEFDEDGNGVLTEAELQEAMQSFDTNNDGVLQPNEITAKFQQAGLKKEDVNDLITYLTSMGNGGVGEDVEIDYESFINGIFSIYDPCTRKDALEILSTVKNIHCSVMDVHRSSVDGKPGAADGSSDWAKSVDKRVDQLQQQVASLDAKMDQVLQAVVGLQNR